MALKLEDVRPESFEMFKGVVKLAGDPIRATLLENKNKAVFEFVDEDAAKMTMEKLKSSYGLPAELIDDAELNELFWVPPSTSATAKISGEASLPPPPERRTKSFMDEGMDDGISMVEESEVVCTSTPQGVIGGKEGNSITLLKTKMHHNRELQNTGVGMFPTSGMPSSVNSNEGIRNTMGIGATATAPIITGAAGFTGGRQSIDGSGVGLNSNVEVAANPQPNPHPVSAGGYNEGGSAGNRALRRAAWQGNVAWAGQLLDLGSNVNAADKWQRTPLIIASLFNRHQVAALLLNRKYQYGAQLEAREMHGDTALLCAAAAGSGDTLRLLVRCGADVHAKDKEGNTALIRVVWFGDANYEEGGGVEGGGGWRGGGGVGGAVAEQGSRA